MTYSKQGVIKDIIITGILIWAGTVFASWYWNRFEFHSAAPVAHSFVLFFSSPISLLPSDFLDSLAPSGCLDICIFPSLAQLLLYSLTPLVTLTLLSSICVLVSKPFLKISIYAKYPIRIGVVIFTILLFHFHRQSACVNDYTNGIGREGVNNEWHEKYLRYTGTLVITGITNTFPKSDELQKYFGIRIIHSVKNGATLVRVPVGREFEYACKLRNYSPFADVWITPMYDSLLKVWGSYIDKRYWTINRP